MPHQFQDFVYWAFCGVLGFCMPSLVVLMTFLVRSINELNLKMAIIVERTANHETRISKLEDTY